MNSFILQTSLRPEQLEELLRDAIPHARLFGSLFDKWKGIGCSGTVKNGFFSIRLGTNYFLICTPFDLLHISGCILTQKNGKGMLVCFVHVHPLFYPIYLLSSVFCIYYGLQGYPVPSASIFGAITIFVFVARFSAVKFLAPFFVERILCFFDSVFTYLLSPYTKKEPAWYFVFKVILLKTGLGIRRRG